MSSSSSLQGTTTSQTYTTVETSAIVCAAFVGALGWDAAYCLPHDLRLLFSTTWLRSPIRILSRLAYMLSRYCALASLMLNISYWYYPHNDDSFCERIPYAIESLMCFSYANTLIILLLRTIALYPTSKKRDWAVFYVILITYTINLAFAIWLPFNVRGGRLPNEPDRCMFTQANGDTALRAFLYSAVAFDVIVLAFTIYKLFSSGTYRFYSRKTFLGRLFLRDSKSTQTEESALTKFAAELIAQGLYDFAAITIVGCGALIAYLSITVVTYQAMTLNCIGAISAALAGGVFRETARAASTMKAIYEQESRLQSILMQKSQSFNQSFDDDEKYHGRSAWQTTPYRSTSRAATIDQEETSSIQSHHHHHHHHHPQPYATKAPLVEEMALDFVCHGNDGEVEEMQESIGHEGSKKVNPLLPLHRQQERQQVISIQNTQQSRTQGASTPEAVITFDRYLSPSSQEIIDNRKRQGDDLLPLEMSLRAFDDGVSTVKKESNQETLASVSVIGGKPVVEYDTIKKNGKGSDEAAIRGLSPPPRSTGRARTTKKH